MTSPFQNDIDAIGRIDAVAPILDVICRTTGMGFAAVARVTEDRWVACQVLDNLEFGLVPGAELQIQTTICNEIRDSREPVVIDHVAEAPEWCTHHTPAIYKLQSYISFPIILHDGRFFGTLCAIDPRPARLDTPETRGMFKLFAELIATHLAADEELQRTREDLREQRELAELREQFIAVLGHDLRNPIAAIASGAKLLQSSVQDERGKQILALMQASLLRVNGLIHNLMDFARARLGDGLQLDVTAQQPLRPMLEHVIDELRSIHPTRIIRTSFDITENVPVDHPRMAQLLSNLLGNALTHGAPASPISVGSATHGGQFELWVANAGKPIPAEALPGLFQPFLRGTSRPNQQGLGLGLYIASEIARVHGGTLEAASTPEETRFTFRMPLHPPEPSAAG
ncbi:GAF domain-containing sensor histidine kinase [Roseomonas xinghualingensis]|uniref:GAF domain-containing sensor histidine kinase n=1 Tax=Roseomonas xinghualingensis TaxID=2986475 RepID=UPI0021F101E2|nr:GAF domain-containing sensor histidine kinase [Roseomonas sp. SXEYE001]MCV4207953.1 GAF domain-containing sensor histidine kinase [Roseomonas sp. SXEYE001]